MWTESNERVNRSKLISTTRKRSDSIPRPPRFHSFFLLFSSLLFSEMPPPHISQWLNNALSTYVYKDQAFQAAGAALDTYPSLKVKTDQYSKSSPSHSPSIDYKLIGSYLSLQPSTMAGLFSSSASTAHFRSSTRQLATTSLSTSGSLSTTQRVLRSYTSFPRVG